MDLHLVDEPLYLDCNGCDVQISPLFAQQLTPFQRDGIRFLYHAYIQKQSGVILNDSSGLGKTIQTALFIEVVLKTFHKRPALILCDAEYVQHWRYIFQIWTNFSKDLMDDIFVSAVNKAEEMSRRQWALVVVDSIDTDNFLKVLQRIETNFKIWITSEHLFGNLKKLHAIHRWLDPGAPCLDKYAARPGTLAARVQARVELDTIFYHVLLRRTDQRVAFNTQVHRELFEMWKTNQTIDRQAYFYGLTNEVAHASTDKVENSSKLLLNISSDQDKTTEVSKKNINHKADKNETFSESKRSRIDVTDKGILFTTISPCQMQAVLANIQITTGPCLPLIHSDGSSNINVPVDEKQNNNKLEQANISNEETSIQNFSFSKSNIEEMNSSDDSKNICGNIEQTHTKTQSNTGDSKEICGNIEQTYTKTQSSARKYNRSENCQIDRSRSSVVANIIEKEDSFSEEADTQRLECTNIKIRSSLKKIEELTNKQFKGSLLDSLF